MSVYLNRLSRNIILVYCIQFCMGLVFSVPNWIAFYRQFLSFTEIGIITAVGYALTVLLELPTGAVADLIGRKKTMIIGFSLATAGYVLLAFSETFAGFLGGTLVFSAGMSLVSGADTAFLYDTLKELGKEKDFTALFAKIGFVHRMGLTIATFTGGYLYVIGSNVPYLAMALANGIIVLISLFLIEPHIDSEKFTVANYIKQTKRGLQQTFKNWYIAKLSFYYLLVGAITWSLLTYFRLPLGYDFGFSQLSMSWILGISFVISSVLLVWLPRFPRIVNPVTVFYAIPLLLGISLVPAIILPASLLPVVMIVIQFLGSARFAFLDAYTNHEFESKYRATALSALNMLVSLFYLLLVAAGGLVQDIAGTKPIATGLGFIALICIFPLTVSLVREYRIHNQRNG